MVSNISYTTYTILFFKFNLPLNIIPPFFFSSSSLSLAFLSLLLTFVSTSPLSTQSVQIRLPLFLHLSVLSFSSSAVGVHLLRKILLIASAEILNNGAYSSTDIPGFSSFNCFSVATAAGESLVNGFHGFPPIFALTASLWINQSGLS
ncbi:hypothetical protein ABW19_dt0209616 [Dactylella cylindrospora]|nr:hypothetical protein ABW19_dt0209616 [Dactylella cylindrospora]